MVYLNIQQLLETKPCKKWQKGDPNKVRGEILKLFGTEVAFLKKMWKPISANNPLLRTNEYSISCNQVIVSKVDACDVVVPMKRQFQLSLFILITKSTHLNP